MASYTVTFYSGRAETGGFSSMVHAFTFGISYAESFAIWRLDERRGRVCVCAYDWSGVR